MTPLPRPEHATLMLPMTDAEDLAVEGNAADGYTALLAGPVFATIAVPPLPEKPLR